MPQDNKLNQMIREAEQSTPGLMRATNTPSLMQERFSSNISPSMDMGLESMTMDMDAINKVRLLMDMGLNEQDALEAVVRERAMGTVRPEEFGGQQMQAPMPRPQTMGVQQMPQQLGALSQMPPQAPPQRPDMRGMSREQMDMLRRGIDPFAEGMVR